MLSKTWRIVLIVVALAAMIWPDLIGASTWWVSLIAVTALLIGEIISEAGNVKHSAMQGNSRRGGNIKKRR